MQLNPYPAKGNAFVKIDNVNNTRLRVEIINGISQLVNDYNEILAGDFFKSLDWGTSSGSYIVRFYANDEKVLQKRSFIVK